MRKFKNLLLVAVLLGFVAFTGCKQETPVDAHKVLKTYLTDNNLDLPVILTDWTVAAKDADSILKDADASNDFYVMDVREAADFAIGHIANAHNVLLVNVITDAPNAAAKTILVVCKTGQTAGYACCALRLKGYKAKVLKWGMSGWNSSLDVITAKVGNVADGHANWNAAPGIIPANVTFGYPVITTEETEGAKILDERINALLSGGFISVTNADVLGTPANYFINNYWAIEDVTKYGNIKGAYRINPLSIVGDEIKNLDPSKTIVSYCWTGMTSSMVSAYLRILGYDAKSLSFGANGMIHSKLEKNKWTTGGNFPIVQ